MSSGIVNHWKSLVARAFPRCPLCGSDSLNIDVKYGSSQDNIYCQSCSAKWKVGYKGDDFKVKYIELLEVSDSEKYGDLVNRKYDPEFWITLSHTREVLEKTPLGKARCKFCGTLFNATLDVCPHCGGER